MYQYISSIAMERTTGAQWKVVDLSEVLVSAIFNNYSDVYLTLSTVYSSTALYVNMKQFEAKYSSSALTLVAFLESLGNAAVETVTALPSANLRYAKYSNAWYAGYKTDLTIIGQSVPEGYPHSAQTDLKMSRPSYTTDMTLIHDYCLVTVNGYLHRTDTDKNYTYIYEGGTTMRKTNYNAVGILSFLDIGKVTKIGLSDTDVYSPETGTALKDRMYISIPGDLTDKSIMLSLGGYLVFQEENIFWPISDNIYALNLSGLPFLERFQESKHAIDFSSLELSVSTDNADIVNVEELFSDVVLKKFMQLSQTFVITIDSDELFTEKHAIRHANLPGIFTAYADPVFPLFVGYGRMAEYWKTKEGNRWSVNVVDAFYRNFVFTYSDQSSLVNVTSNNQPGHLFYHSRGHLVGIGAYV